MDEATMSDEQQFLYLTTTGWKTGRPHEIEIWFVVWRDGYYLISERGRASHWVQNIERDPRVSFRVADKILAGSARKVGEAEIDVLKEVSRLMKKKYGWNDGLVVELRGT